MKNVKISVICIIVGLIIMIPSCKGIEKNDTETGASATTDASFASTTTPTQSVISLDMPDKIEMRACYASSFDLTIQKADAQTLWFIQGDGTEKKVKLSNEQIEEINTLYRSISDFTNVSAMQEPGGDTTMYVGDQTYEFWSILTTQVELEQYIKLLRSYYSGYEYDWSVEPPINRN